MDYGEIRKISLKVFIGFLGLTALIAIITLLSGKFRWFQWRVLGTSLTITAASVCAMSCAAFIEKKKQVLLGMTGIVLCVSAAILLIAGMWTAVENEICLKITITLGVFGAGFAHAFLLFLPELGDRYKWVQPASSVSIGILALLIVVFVWGEFDNDLYFRILAAVAIIVSLETIVIPILMKLRKTTTPGRIKLVLEKIDDDIYRDSEGNEYKLKPLIPGQGTREQKQ
jgi:hypothetical protein